MELNFVLFPAPPPAYTYSLLANRLIFIPRAPIINYKSDFTASHDFGDEPKHIPCLMLKSPTGSSKVLLYFHGNAEDIGHTQELLEHLRDSIGFHIISVEYPGYGIYPGSPNATRLTEDAINVYDYLAYEAKIGEENIIVFGRSIGTGPAVHLAAIKHPAILTLMSAYTSLRAVVKNLVGRFLQYAVRERFLNKEMIKAVTCPVFLIHGMKDQLIPYQQSQELLQACQNAPCYLSLPEIMDHSEFDFLNDLSFPLKEFCNKFDIRKEDGNLILPEEILRKPKDFPSIGQPGFLKSIIQKYI